ncbi:MAG: N-acetyl-gamma-glutamyl-phosphate reductase [Candidatus Omnitrophota bacterium]
MHKVSVSIAGVTGYTGEELLKLSVAHPNIDVVSLFASEDKAKDIADLYPYLKGRLNLPCMAFDPVEAAKADAVFLALPHGLSMEVVPKLRQANAKKIIDLSADYRLTDLTAYPVYYDREHTDIKGLDDAVYGMPEINRAAVKNADFIANPGCYPTAIILALWPLLKSKATWSSPIVIDAKSGVSGAGRNSATALQFAEANDSFKAYKVDKHAHEGEIVQAFKRAGANPSFSFVPHLLPIHRGILATIYIHDLKGLDSMQGLYDDAYREEAFVQVLPNGKVPEIKDTLKTNQCHIGITYKEQSNSWIIVSAIDNLQKGAAAQAIQNFNLMHGLDEQTGLA